MIVMLVDPLEMSTDPGAYYVAAVQTGLPPLLVAGPLPTHAEAVDLIDRAHSLPAVRPTHFTTAKALGNSLGVVLGSTLPRGRYNKHFGLEG